MKVFKSNGNFVTPPPPEKMEAVDMGGNNYKRLLLACDGLLKNYRHLLGDYYDLLTHCQNVLLKNRNVIDYYRSCFERPPGATNTVSALYRFDDQTEIRIGKLI